MVLCKISTTFTTMSSRSPAKCLCAGQDAPFHLSRLPPQVTRPASLKASRNCRWQTGTTVCSAQTLRKALHCSTQQQGRHSKSRRTKEDRLGRLTARCSSDDTDPAEPDAMAESQMPDWRQFRARLIATDKGKAETSSRWAHDVPKPEKGCLLLAHPLMFGNTQSYFSQAVIFLFEHGADGSAGFILNRPTELTLGQLVAADTLLPEFADNPLYLGGDVGSDTMHFLHGCADTQGALEVVDGVFMGGFESARSAVRTGSKQADQFRWFNKYAGWGPGQLDQEVTTGVWFTVAASSEVILNHQNLARSDMWHSVLEMMGGDYTELSNSVKEAYPDSLPRDDI